jgi:asparagine synthase (glutamine-hydrolysing)
MQGYERYALSASRVNRFRKIPAPLRVLSRYLVSALSPITARTIPLISGLDSIDVDTKLHSLSALLHSDPAPTAYEAVSTIANPQLIASKEVRQAAAANETRIANVRRAPGLSDREFMQLIDFGAYLPGDILTKVDRASMHVSLEVRVPLLDHRVVEYCWGLDDRFRTRGKTAKWGLKQILGRYIDTKLIDRPKMGFAVPMDEWVRGPLRDWVADTITPTTLRDQGIFDTKAINSMWANHQSNRRDWGQALWSTALLTDWVSRRGLSFR